MPSSKGGSKSSSTHSQKNGKKVGKSTARPASKSAVQSGAKVSTKASAKAGAAVSLKAGKAAAKPGSKPASQVTAKKGVAKKGSGANAVSAKNRVTVGAVEVAKSLKKAISGVLKVAHAPAALTQGKAEVKGKIKAGKSAGEPSQTQSRSMSEMTGVVLAAQTQSAVKSAQAPELAQKSSSEGSKALTKKAQPEKKTLARTRVANKKSSDAKKYHGAILLKFEDGSCRDAGCESHATTGQYCRMHYIKNWKKIKQREELMKEGTLNRFIEELVAKYPDKYIEAIRHDLAHDQEFAKVVADLEIDDAAEPTEEFADDEDSNSDHFIEHIRRDFGEGDGEAF